MDDRTLTKILESEFKALNERFDHFDTKITNVERNTKRLEKLVSNQQTTIAKCRGHCEEARAELWTHVRVQGDDLRTKISEQRERLDRRNGEEEGREKEAEKRDKIGDRAALRDYYYYMKLSTLFLGCSVFGSAVGILLLKLLQTVVVTK